MIDVPRGLSSMTVLGLVLLTWLGLGTPKVALVILEKEVPGKIDDDSGV